MFGRDRDVEVTLYGVHEKIPEHDLDGTSQIVYKLKQRLSEMESEIEVAQVRIKDAKTRLTEAGFDESAVRVKFMEAHAAPVDDAKKEVQQGEYGTVVVARSERKGFVLGGTNVAKELADDVRDAVVIMV
jgi:hypothetical protein